MQNGDQESKVLWRLKMFRGLQNKFDDLIITMQQKDSCYVEIGIKILLYIL